MEQQLQKLIEYQKKINIVLSNYQIDEDRENDNNRQAVDLITEIRSFYQVTFERFNENLILNHTITSNIYGLQGYNAQNIREDLITLRAKLDALRQNDFHYKSVTPNNNQTVNVHSNQIQDNNQSINMIFNYETTVSNIENSSALTQSQISELKSLINELKVISETNDPKPNKWENFGKVANRIFDMSLAAGQLVLGYITFLADKL